MCHCLSQAVRQHTVLLRLLSSAMLVTPGPLPVRRCWWDGSLTGPAAAPDMPLIYNAQLWQRNQRCLYAKLAGARSWWEMSHSLLFRTDTHFMLWLYPNDTHRSVPVCCCAACNGGSYGDTASQRGEAWWNEIYSNNDMEMRLRSTQQFQKQIRINPAQPAEITIMNSAANLTISSQPQTIMAFSGGASIRLIYTGLESSSDYITNI